ncbi:gasdermin-E [Chanos chanos]|uniref:Gasdermin-E n=1 Tax=Chanos chanos TaxID=29144 RepID=A0A6J2WG38_CHACN|nr:gasdermin-E-like [Chanos chanos]
MFAKATRELLRQVDPEGTLIPVSRLNDSDKLEPLAVVLKRTPVWFWQRAKYRPTDFTLSHLLLGGPIQPELEESEFLKYKGTYGGNVGVAVRAGAGGVRLNLEAQACAKLQSTFGKLRKQDVNVQRLLLDSRDKMVNMQHSLIKQRLGCQVLAVLKERIITTRPCTITHTGQDQGSCAAILGALGAKTVQVCVKDSNTLQLDRDVTMEIPPNTVIAYSVIELNIKSNGQYDLCLQPDVFGGFEEICEASENCGMLEVDGVSAIPAIKEGELLSVLKKALSGVKPVLCVLTDMSIQARDIVLSQLRQILRDRLSARLTLSVLEEKLSGMCQGETPDSALFELSHPLSLVIRSFLEMVQPDATNRNGETATPSNQNGSPFSACEQNQSSMEAVSQNGSHLSPSSKTSSLPHTNQKGTSMETPNQNRSSAKPPNHNQTLLTAMHLLVSSIEELSDEGLGLIEGCCSPDVLRALGRLVSYLVSAPQPLPLHSMPLPLQNEDVFQRAEQLFRSANVLFRRERDGLCAVIGDGEEHLPLNLCITLAGLDYLCTQPE